MDWIQNSSCWNIFISPMHVRGIDSGASLPFSIKEQGVGALDDIPICDGLFSICFEYKVLNYMYFESAGYDKSVILCSMDFPPLKVLFSLI